MAYQIGHAPAPNVASAAVWVADNTSGGGSWYSIQEFVALLKLTNVAIPNPSAANEVLTSTGTTAGAWAWKAPTYF